MSLIKALALAIALAASASPFGDPELPLQHDPVDPAWAQDFG